MPMQFGGPMHAGADRRQFTGYRLVIDPTSRPADSVSVEMGTNGAGRRKQITWICAANTGPSKNGETVHNQRKETFVKRPGEILVMAV
jgi:hypothetical protein